MINYIVWENEQSSWSLFFPIQVYNIGNISVLLILYYITDVFYFSTIAFYTCNNLIKYSFYCVHYGIPYKEEICSVTLSLSDIPEPIVY